MGVIHDKDDEVGVLGVLLGVFENGTDLTLDELYLYSMQKQREQND